MVETKMKGLIKGNADSAQTCQVYNSVDIKKENCKARVTKQKRFILIAIQN